MKPVFEILPEAIFFQQTNLICELSRDGFSYIFENDVDKKISGLYVFEFEDSSAENLSNELFNLFKSESLLQKGYKKVFISYSEAESLLLPDEYYKPGENTNLLNMLYGDLHEGTVLTDAIPDKQIYNIYRIPESIHHVLINQFPVATLTHQYTLLVKQKVPQENVLKVIFYKNKMVVVAAKEKKLQMIQTFTYQTDTDVVYHLLNISNQLNMTDVQLQIGGMIEDNSSLYRELKYNYQNISFDDAPVQYELADAFRKYPPHYFSHLFSLVL